MKKVGSLIRQLLPRRDVPLRQNARAQKLLLLLLTPLTAFWLMQLVLGSPPWNMSVGVALANWLSERTLLDRLCDHRLSGGLLRAAAHSGRYVGRLRGTSFLSSAAHLFCRGTLRHSVPL